MASKRKWSQWPGRFAHELNGVSGVATAGGTIMSIVGLAALSGVIGVVTGGIGGLVVAGAIGAAAMKAIPPKRKLPSEVVGQRLSLDVLATVYPPPPKLSIVGPSLAGKSTLLKMIRHEPPPSERTSGVHACVTALQTTPERYVAIVDGGGHMFADQFAVAAPADILCVILDHHPSDDQRSLDQERIREHARFSEQLRGYLSSQEKHAIVWLHLLVNKRDLWEATSEEDRRRLEDFVGEEQRTWEGGNWAKKVTSSIHSNRDATDIGRFVQGIVDFMREQDEHTGV